MIELEIFMRSADACLPGKPRADGVYFGADGQVWNPFTNDYHRWLCVKKLLENDGTVIFSDFLSRELHEWYRGIGDATNCFGLVCPAEEFPARALAELAARTETATGTAK